MPRTGSPKNDSEKVDTEKVAKKANAPKGQPKDAQKKDQNRGPRKNPDWMHINAVAYNADLDQIVLSSPNFCEIWIIDHSTTKDEAKGHTGGRRGKGGDILYRWGNPRAFGSEQSSINVCSVSTTSSGFPRALAAKAICSSSITVADALPRNIPRSMSLFRQPIRTGITFAVSAAAFGPDKAVWSYTAPNKKDFYSWFISGAQRLPNGNTLINSGATGVVFEVTSEHETVWKFANPFKNDGRASSGRSTAGR